MMSVLLTRPNSTPCGSQTNTFPMRVRVIFINASSALLLGSMTTTSSRNYYFSCSQLFPFVLRCLLYSLQGDHAQHSATVVYHWKGALHIYCKVFFQQVVYFDIIPYSYDFCIHDIF